MTQPHCISLLQAHVLQCDQTLLPLLRDGNARLSEESLSHSAAIT